METTDAFAVWRAIKMGRDDRGVMIGKTGCGKTTLAKFLVEDERKPFSVTWNPKGSDGVLAWNQAHVTSLGELYDAADDDAQRIVYTPDPFVAEDAINQAELFYWVYENKNRRFYIDEATSIAYPGSKIPKPLTAILNRGRERGVSALVATQRPSGVPMNILSESEHYYVFKTLLPQDRQRIEAITGIGFEDQASLDDYQFYYFNVSKGLLTYVNERGDRLPRRLKLNLEGVKAHGSRTRVASV